MRGIAFAGILLISPAWSQTLIDRFYPNSKPVAPPYIGTVVELTLQNQLKALGVGFEVAELGVIEIECGGIDGTISIDPFKYALTKACAKHGANAFQLSDDSIVNKNTKAYIRISAKALRVSWKSEVFNFLHDYDGWGVARIGEKLEREEKVQVAARNLAFNSYAIEREALAQKANREVFENAFGVEWGETEESWLETELESLPQTTRDTMEKYFGRKLGGGTVEALLKRENLAFDRIAKATRIQKLKDLGRKYPNDYGDFRGLFIAVHGYPPEEDSVINPVKAKSKRGSKGAIK